MSEYQFPGKVGSDLGEEKPIRPSIRWTTGTQFVRVRRISDLVKYFLWGLHHKSTVLEILSELSEDPDLNESDLGEVYCIYI